MASQPFSLAGKAALITGGTSGIGLATARRFVDAGADVVIGGRRAEGADIARDIGAHFIGADVADPQAVAAMCGAAADHLGGGIDALLCHAGAVEEFIMIEDTTDDVLETMFAVNALGPYRVLRSAIPHLRDHASVVLNASLVTLMGNIGETAYSAAKSALVSLTKGAAMELAPRRIRVNLISPGPTDGAMWPEDHPQRDVVATLCPLGRFGQPDEIAALCHFLAADECRILTGAHIAIDGGMSAGFAPQMLERLMTGPDHSNGASDGH